MQVSRQTCSCGSTSVCNIVVNKGDQPQHVYVRCEQCGELIAYYELRGYHDQGMDLESYLKVSGNASGDSAREWLAEFRRRKEEVISGYQSALADLESGRDGGEPDSTPDEE